jgi:glycine oxidase
LAPADIPKRAPRAPQGPLEGLRVVVAGAGAIGSAVALRLLDDGAEVLLADPAPLAANASGVAAGMLAPAFEAVLDPLAAGHFELLKTARELWPALAARVGAELDRSGALWVGDEASNADMLKRLTGPGARAEGLDGAGARRSSPGLAAPQGAVFTPEDWTLDPAGMLAALRGAFEAAGGKVRAAAVTSWDAGTARLSDGGQARADALVLAAGLAAQGLDLPPPELAQLRPIKGQIVSLDAQAPRSGPVVRGEGVYLVPRASGPVAGATMEAGVRDLEVDPAAVQGLRSAAARLFPALAAAPVSGRAGVRASSPDGLPLVGRSLTPGAWLAMGARRNGWLLAPLVAELLAGQLAGAEDGHAARLFDPGRFTPD